jgi:hypothetical protein
VGFGRIATRTYNIVLKGRAVRRDVSCDAFPEGVVRTQHGDGYTTFGSGVRQAKYRRAINSPTFDVWQLKTSSDFVRTISNRRRLGKDRIRRLNKHRRNDCQGPTQCLRR